MWVTTTCYRVVTQNKPETRNQKGTNMKKIMLKINAPKCGASSDQLKQVLADVLGADRSYIGARLSILPPDVKSVVNNAVKMVRKVYEQTLPWIGNERVCADEKVDIIIEEIESAMAKAKAIIEEQRQAMSTWLPQVRQALGKGADMVALPDPNDFTITHEVSVGEPSKAGRGLPRDATQAEVAEAVAVGKGYEAVIDHLIGLAEKVGPGKEGNAAALRLKEDAATAAKLGAVNKEMLGKLNRLTAALLKAGTGGAKKAAAKAAVVTAIMDGAATANDAGEDEAGGETGGDKEAAPAKSIKKVLCGKSEKSDKTDKAVELI